jgi:hypothetical protein
MKNYFLLLFFLLTTAGFLTGQVVVNSDITTNTTWTSNNIYLLQGGCLYVRNNATLTIEPGTLIKGDAAAIIVLRGSKIIADGTKERPIVFTSNKPAGQRAPGDWGGILLMGRAPINVPGGEATVEGGCDQALYGGNDPNDNSGILRYVRIEFAGIPFQPNNELNSLTLGGVGAGTIIEHVQTSYGGDDAYEWFGGTVNGKWLIAYRTVDDIFDVDFGYSGSNQWLLGVSDPNIADVSGSNGFESDNDAAGSNNMPQTNGHFSNVSIFGPIQPNGPTPNSNFQRALHIRRNSALDVFNSCFTGFPTGFRPDGTASIGNLTSGSLEFRNNIIAGCPTPINPAGDPAVQAAFDAGANSILTNVTDVMVTDPFNATNPNFLPLAGSPLQAGADFTAATLNNGFFTPTTYRGAFGNTDWTDCWAEWDPINANYTNSINYGLNPAISQTTTDKEVAFTGTTPGAVSYLWDFGDGSPASTQENPTHTYPGTGGTFNVSLTVTSSRGCTATATASVGITAVNEVEGLSNLKVFPNPFSAKTTVDFTLKNQMELNVELLDMTGRTISLESRTFDAGFNRFEIDGANLSGGIYFLRFMSAEGQKTVRISVLK